jgi:hypothetical protein
MTKGVNGLGSSHNLGPEGGPTLESGSSEALFW